MSQCSTQLSEYAARQLHPGCIDLSAGYPGQVLLPDMRLLADTIHGKLAEASADPYMLTYGPRTGSGPFRQQLSNFLTQEYGHSVPKHELMATAGVSHGLDLACGNLAAPGDTIAVEGPTYYLAHQIFQRRRLKVVSLPTDDQGLDTAALQGLLASDSSFRPRLVYTIPVHNNPRGTILPRQRRSALVSLAHQYGFIVLADEVYQLLTFPGAPPVPPPMRAFEDPQVASTPSSRVLSFSSFSKIFAPGLRLGWVEGSAHLLSQLAEDGVINSGGCINHFTASVAEAAIESGLLQAHLRRVVRPNLSAQCEALCQALSTHLPSLPFHASTGGYFVWLHLPPEVEPNKFATDCQEHGVKVTPGPMCGDGDWRCVRLSFSFYPAAELEVAVQRLAACLQPFL